MSDQANGRVRPNGRYACAAAILLRNLLRKQPVGGIGDLREPSGVHANVRIVRFSWSTHFVAAFRRRWAVRSNRHFPDDSETSVNSSDFAASLEAGTRDVAARGQDPLGNKPGTPWNSLELDRTQCYPRGSRILGGATHVIGFSGKGI